MSWSPLLTTRLRYEFASRRDSRAHGLLENLQGVAELWKRLTTNQVKSPQWCFALLMIQISNHVARGLFCNPLGRSLQSQGTAPPFSHVNVVTVCTTKCLTLLHIWQCTGSKRVNQQIISWNHRFVLPPKKSYKMHKELGLTTLGTAPINNKELLSQTTHHLNCWQDATEGNIGTRWGWISTKIAWRKAEVQASPFLNHLFMSFAGVAQMQMT